MNHQRQRVKTLVMVEDDAPFRRSLERASRHRRPGYRWEMCATLAQACAFLATVEPRDPSIRGLLVDVRLPDGSGLEFLGRARQALPDVPALVMTGDPETRTQAEELGAGWVLKANLDITWIVDELELQRARSAMRMPAAAKLLARAYDLRYPEVRLVVAIAAGASRSNLDDELGHAACKSTLNRLGKRTGMHEVEQIRIALVRIQNRGEIALRGYGED